MPQSVICPICLSRYGASCTQFDTYRNSSGFDCTVCGRYELSGSVYAGQLDPERQNNISSLKRAALSHHLRTARTAGMVKSDWLKYFLANAKLPSPAIQASNIIRYIGEHYLNTGSTTSQLQPSLYAIIGAPNPEFAGNLLLELKKNKLVEGLERRNLNSPPELLDATLTLEGWARFEEEKAGKIAGNYGFLAMEFGDETLDRVAEMTIKKCVKEQLGYDLVDMRDVPEAGIIDNIMRTRIRDSAFVVVDLTHDNSGAYWEGGFAEGLGKPVIYICEEEKFNTKKTHFDTNHCTTVPWNKDKLSVFESQFVATIRRSLNLFDQ